MVDGLFNGQPLPPTTFVIFETGCAPVRDQVRIDIPIIVTKVSYIGAAFPTLKPQGNYVPGLTVTANGESSTRSWFRTWTASSASISKMKCRSSSPKPSRPPWSRAWPLTPRTRPPGSKATGRGCCANRHRHLSGRRQHRRRTHLDDAPKQFQVCHVPTPPDRKIELDNARRRQKIQVTIAHGTINLVYVKSIDAASPLLVSQMKLK